MELIGQPISRHEALRISRAILERAEQERNNLDLLLARHILCRGALAGWAWAVALKKYLQELEARVGVVPVPYTEVDWEQAPMEVR